MSDYPNIARLALADPDKLTSRQLQIHCIRQDYEKPARGSMHQVDKDARMAAAVPALLAHIDELYGQINALKAKCGKQADMLAHHCQRRDEQNAEIERLRKYNETTKYHQDQHAAALRELEKFRADHTEVAAAEFEQMARDLYRRADNLPLNDERQVQRLGDFREIGDKLMARAENLRGAR